MKDNVIKTDFNSRKCEFCGKLLKFPEGLFLVSLRVWICDTCKEKHHKDVMKFSGGSSA